MDDFTQIQLANDQKSSNNMDSPIQAYANSVIFSFVGVLVFITCVLCGMWIHRLYTTRGFHLADFERLTTEARSLAQETSLIRKDVEGDYSSDLAVKILNMERINAAEELDSGIRVALSAWEDIMQPDEGDALDEEDGVGGGKIDRKGKKKLRERRKSHGRYVMGLMRSKCFEGVERREEFSPGLQAMHLEVLSRKIDVQAGRINRRLANGSSTHGTPRKSMPKRIWSLSHSQLSAESPMNEKYACASSPAQRSALQGATSALLPTPQRSTSIPFSDDERYGMLGPVQKERTYV
ncbi:uncharacterized protein RAG0_13315 [Rhynchosporium agropyri]|uniref:Uncharacterized protein n=1 Tax=Rhynchosporium agropyri TaxID=914238 RepID=A0A1E1LCJ8_9HELO|nr:uncharacterized protein RAG0_13315 [Rhynchosporium agropyri]